jgi:hypothetical protein
MNRALNQIPKRAEKRRERSCTRHSSILASPMCLTRSITRSFMAADAMGRRTRWHILHRNVPREVT